MKINVALVTTRDKVYTKAIAHCEDNELTVTDRRGKMVLRVDAPKLEKDGQFHYGEDTVVQSLGGCGCGGMVTENR